MSEHRPRVLVDHLSNLILLASKTKKPGLTISLVREQLTKRCFILTKQVMLASP